MRKGFYRALVLAAIAVSITGFSTGSVHTKEMCDGFVPENTMRIPVGHKHQWAFFDEQLAGITEAQFNQVIDRFEKIYGPDFTKAGATLSVNRKWSDATVNASAQQSGKTWIVNMYGGLARHPAITLEGFSLVICHEGGHHIGGAPKMKDWFGRPAWATNEGGADYFSTLKCLRRMFAEDDNETIIANSQIEELAKNRCEAEFSTRADKLLCMRGSLAGTSVALLFMDLRKETTKPKFDTPDPKIAEKMFDAHPPTQCRLDTYFAGASCRVDVSNPVSDGSFRDGACVEGNDPYGWRPKCWFKTPAAIDDVVSASIR